MNPDYLILILTGRCNLSCAYCYMSGALGDEVMSRSVAAAALDLTAAERPFHVQITGGEPTLAPVEAAWIIRYIWGKYPGATIGIQTNGAAMDRSFAEICAGYDARIGISLDGPPHIHNRIRGDCEQTLRTMRLLSDMGILFQVTTVVSSMNVLHLGALAVFLSAFPSVTGIGLDILVKKGRARGNQAAMPPEPDKLRQGIWELIKTLNLVNARRPFPILLREAELIKNMADKKTKPFCNAISGKSLAVMPDGRLFPCAQLANTPGFYMGTLEKPVIRKAGLPNKFFLKSDDCQACPVYGHCPGECLSRVYHNGSKRASLACVMYQTLWESINKRQI